VIGRVYLVGAGPGDPGLITVRGLELLRRADVVLHDRLVAPELVGAAPADALTIDVGKLPGRGRGRARENQIRIHRLLVRHAAAGRLVVRLKGGDPFVFGRGAEEVTACRAAGIPCEVVPGISSAIAGPAAAGVAVTRRGVARAFVVVSGHGEDGEDNGSAPFPAALAGALAAIDTVVVLMGRRTLRETARLLVEGGRDPTTPVACIQSATTAAQAVVRGTLADIAERVERSGLATPLVAVIGAVAAPTPEPPSGPRWRR
jgi:uroporphyrin-III C-methyltransferase